MFANENKNSSVDHFGLHDTWTKHNMQAYTKFSPINATKHSYCNRTAYSASSISLNSFQLLPLIDFWRDSRKYVNDDLRLIIRYI